MTKSIKLLLVIVGCCAWLAVQVNATGINVTVAPIPESQRLSLNTQNLDFGTAQPPSNMFIKWQFADADPAFQITCKANDTWSVSLAAQRDFIHADGITTIPISKVQWMCAYTQDADSYTSLSYQTAWKVLSKDIPDIIYSSASPGTLTGDPICGGKVFKLIFMIDVPQNAKAGDYTTLLAVRMDWQ